MRTGYKNPPHFTEALKIREDLLGDNHPLVAKSLLGLAQLCAKANKLDKAQHLLERALDIQTRVLGADHPDVATTYNLLGNVALQQHRVQTACEMQNKCLRIRDTRLSPNHPDLGVALIDRARAEASNHQIQLFQLDLERGTEILMRSCQRTPPGQEELSSNHPSIDS